MIDRWRWIYSQLPQNQHKVGDLKHNSLSFVFSASRLWYKAYIYFWNLGLGLKKKNKKEQKNFASVTVMFGQQ